MNQFPHFGLSTAKDAKVWQTTVFPSNVQCLLHGTVGSVGSANAFTQFICDFVIEFLHAARVAEI